MNNNPKGVKEKIKYDNLSDLISAMKGRFSDGPSALQELLRDREAESKE